jgi:hypothetical protein
MQEILDLLEWEFIYCGENLPFAKTKSPQQHGEGSKLIRHI